MKKLNYLLLGLAGLAMASCSQDDLIGPANGDGNVNITVKLPGDMATRALSDGLTADNLHIAVYDYNATTETNTYVFETEASFGGAIETTVSLNLPQGKTYNIAFFAVSPTADGTLYQFKASDETPCIYVDYNNYGSSPNLADAYDCFYKLASVTTNTTAISKTVELTRPVAQINWGTNDLSQAVVDDAAFGENGQNLYSNLTIDGAYQNFGLLTSNVIGSQSENPITISALASPASNATSAQWAYPVDPATYKYIAMQYVLAPASDTGNLFDVSLDCYNAPDKSGATIQNEAVEVNNCPLQANYRTNIYGSLLTNPNDFTVVKIPTWNNPDYDPSLELAFQRGGTFTLGHDYTIDTRLIANKNLTINLNGYSITSNYNNDGFILVDGATLTITGNGSVTDGNPDDNKQTIVWVTGGGTANIQGGNFTGYDEGQLIYVEEGTANISGGTFWLKDDPSGDNWCLNCNDANYKNGTANIYVTGGTFYNWNPADNSTEGPGINFVTKGYKVVTSTSGSDTLYMVVPDNAITVDGTTTTMEQALTQAKDGDTIYVLAGTFATPTTFNKSVTIKGLGAESSILQANNAYWTSSGANLTFEDIQLKSFVNNSNHTSMAFIGAANETFTNVLFDGEFHVESGNASFTNCGFNYYAITGNNYQLWCQTEGTIDITNCSITCNGSKAILVYGATADTTGGNINIDGLTVTNTGVGAKALVEIHSENYTAAGTINIDNVTYTASDFGAGLWQEVYNKAGAYEGQKTNYYKVIVNGVTEQVGGYTGPYPAN